MLRLWDKRDINCEFQDCFPLGPLGWGKKKRKKKMSNLKKPKHFFSETACM
jgi:hypothetical protein